MKNEHDDNIVVFPSSWIDPLSVQNPFTNLCAYQDLFNRSPFHSPIRCYCVHFGNDLSIPIKDDSFVSQQQSLLM